MESVRSLPPLFRRVSEGQLLDTTLTTDNTCQTNLLNSQTTAQLSDNYQTNAVNYLKWIHNEKTIRNLIEPYNYLITCATNAAVTMCLWSIKTTTIHLIALYPGQYRWANTRKKCSWTNTVFWLSYKLSPFPTVHNVFFAWLSSLEVFFCNLTSISFLWPT